MKKFLAESMLIILASSVALLYPLLLSAFLIISLYRYLVIWVVQRDRKTGKIVSGMSACIAGANPCTKPMSRMIPYYMVTSKVDKYEVMRLFTDKILKPAINSGKCIYPELKQKLVRKYGYLFWYENENFRLEDHIKYVNEQDPDSPMTRKDLHEYITQTLLTTPFDESRSPWEILLARNAIDEDDPNVKSAIIFRYNHCLMDGYALIGFMQNCAVKPWRDLSATPKAPELSTLQKMHQYLILFSLGPYLFVKFLLFTNDNHQWIKTSITNFNNHLSYHDMRPKSIRALKRIKNHFKVNLTSVLYAALAEATRQAMENDNVSPSKIHIAFPFPIPGHSGKLTNHWAPAKLPVRFYKNDVEKTLRYIDKEYKAMLHHPFLPLTNWMVSKVCGVLPISFIPKTDNIVCATFLMSNFPGPAHTIDLFGYEVTEFFPGANHLPGFAINVALLSYKGHLRIIVAGDSCLLPENKDAQAIVNALENIINRWEFQVERKND